MHGVTPVFIECVRQCCHLHSSGLLFDELSLVILSKLLIYFPYLRKSISKLGYVTLLGQEGIVGLKSREPFKLGH